MKYMTILLNADAYGRVSRVKKKVEERLQHKLSFGDLFNEVFGKNLDFLDLDDELRNYVKYFCERLQEKSYVLGILLFGSVAKGHGYNKYSDIDMLVVVSSRADVGKVMDYIHEIKKEMHVRKHKLISKQLPTFISPIVLEENSLETFRPIHLDFLDYGVVLFERRNALTDFLNGLRGIKHRRDFKPYEVLTWQT